MAHATGESILNSESRSAPNFPSTGGASSLSGSHTDAPVRTTSAAYPSRPEPAKPVAIAHAESGSFRSHHSDLVEKPDAPYDESVQDVSYLTHPPRLPLPIEEEVHTPGSPIIAPIGSGEPLEAWGLTENTDGDLARKSSILSESSRDEDEENELRIDKDRPLVSMKIEWLRGGEKVYVTGTIFNWSRKMRLNPIEGKPGCFATIVNIFPGTHHLRFLVDGLMTTSPDLPTTVDFGNNLVNYIEVSPEDLIASRINSAAGASTKSQEAEEAGKKRRFAPALEKYSQDIAPYLLDYDQTEENQDYVDGMTAVEKLPSPPGLPGFLTKPILNHQSLVKDDNSVLTMPNHTMLNHLATSSIRHGILAVSATTRYRDKYVTTIIYKPSNDEVQRN